jgi:2-(1,2-epoxy-1,2-dihydrophenyl)acetyl-CoA isomerase
MTVKLEKRDGIATVTLDRPEKLNALSEEMYDKLYQCWNELAADDATRAVILTGAGRAFSAGGDITNMAKSDIVSGRARSHHRHRVILALANLEKPVIAAVRGPCYGIANGLALACDIIIASDTARFSMAFKRVGVVPDGGTIFFLTQYLGIAKAKELVYTARQFGAQEAKDMGIVARVVPDADLEREAQALSRELAASATYALALAKKMFQSMYVPTLEMLLDTEKLASGMVRLTHDHKEGVQAFLEKRQPKFEGR